MSTNSLFKQNRPEIPVCPLRRPRSLKPRLNSGASFFESKRDHLYQIEIFYCVVLEGARSKTGVWRGSWLASSAILQELLVSCGRSSTNNSMKTLLRSQIEHDRARLEQRVQAFQRQLADFRAARSVGPGRPVLSLPSPAQLRRLAHRGQAAVHTVSRLPGSE